MIYKYNNPVLSGFYPDPSICRVEKDFYLVTSTFAYFPGIPIFHSSDLINWKQIGNAIDRPGQLCYDENQISEGLFAPTIRYNNGTFYILCTLVKNGGNFIITAKDPAGPWSDPVWLEGAPGIDPSIFFDDDGKVWYCGTDSPPDGEAYPGNKEIYIRQMDLSILSEGKNPLIGKNIGIWQGALIGAIWSEGPHIYKVGNWYYLLYAEGGTGLDHAVCVARAKDICGPWEGKKSNPVITHRHLGKKADIINVGHADITDDINGNWWMVLLASRQFEGVCPLGRETFMVPIYWEDEWPWFDTRTGLIESEYCVPVNNRDSLMNNDWYHESSCDQFNGKLPLNWLALRMPVKSEDAAFSLTKRHGTLRLFTVPQTIRSREHPAFAGRRIRHKNWAFSVSMEFTPKESSSAGIILLQSEDWHYRLEISSSGGNTKLNLIRAAGKEDEIIAAGPFDETEKPFVIAAHCIDMKLSFFFGKDQHSMNQFYSGDSANAHILSTEYAGGFVGSLAGVYATGNGNTCDNYADFLWAEYREL